MLLPALKKGSKRQAEAFLFSMAEPIQTRFNRGLYLPEADLWLDPWEPKPRAFVSHAHADHVAPHAWSCCSSRTGKLLELRFGRRGVVSTQEFGSPFPLGPGGEFEGELWPAGHVLGSAQLLVRRRRDGATLLYTGDFKLRPGEAAERVEVRPADTLCLETTFGRPHLVLPPAEEVIRGILRFVREALEEGCVPMLGAYALGKTQELMVALGRLDPDLRFLLHRSADAITRYYREEGYPVPPWEVLEGEPDGEGRVIIVPPSVLRSQTLRRVRQRVTAVVTGWALERSATYRYQVDEAFPLSDHADYPALLRMVELVNPERVLTLHGFADEFARDLRARGREAWSLTGGNQLELFEAEDDGPPPELAREDGEVPPVEGEPGFGGLVRVCEDLTAIASRPGKVRRLAEFLGGLEAAAVKDAVTCLTGRAFERTDARRTAQVGWAICKRALLEASGRPEAEYRKIAAGQNDAGRVARLLLEGRTAGGGMSWAELRRFLDELAEARGPVAKVALLQARLRALDAQAGAWLIRVLSGDLRTGMKEGFVEEAVALAFGQPAAAVRRACLLTGSLGRAAELARAGRLDTAGVTPFVPLRCMLASPEESAQELWLRLGEARGTVWLEDKFDGIRAQLHRVGDRVEIYSRDLRSLTAEFAELEGPARALGEDVILDGEIVAEVAAGSGLGFFELQKRLGRRCEGDLFQGSPVPVRFLAFDLLWRGGESFLDRPLRERREALEALPWGGTLDLVARCEAGSPAEVEAAFQKAKGRGHEGLMGKDPESGYALGRRGHAWVKFKRPLATLDCVVVRAEEGHGKCSHVLSDYTFAVRDEERGCLVVVGKAYSGLTDKEIEVLTEEFKAITIKKVRRVHLVEPRVVLEIAFDSIQASGRHESGLALRFPRIVAIRRDKTVEEIDTLGRARKLAERAKGSWEGKNV